MSRKLDKNGHQQEDTVAVKTVHPESVEKLKMKTNTCGQHAIPASNGCNMDSGMAGQLDSWHCT